LRDYSLVKSETVFKGKIISVTHDTIMSPENKEVMRETVMHNGGATIIPIDNNGDIIYVRQYRHAAKGQFLEIPAGSLNKDEDPQVCAIRELEEETGYKAGKCTHITSMYASVGYCDEIINIYLAEDLSEGVQCLDEDEFVTIEKYSLQDSVNMIFSGEIKDSKTIVAILAYKELLSRR